MQIMDILAQTGGLKSMARELGASEAQVETGAAALIPASSALDDILRMAGKAMR